jgi:ribosome-associated toxin RatA of RatAB toxin-antitoxin module
MSKNTIERMFQYLDGQSEASFITEFEAQLNTDPEFATEWKQFLVEQYLADTLNPEWRITVENLRATDIEFEREIKFQQSILHEMRDTAQAELKAEISEILPPQDQDYGNPGLSKRTIRYALVLAAACIGLLIIFKFNPWQSAAIPSSLYAEYFEPYPMLLSSRSAAKRELEEIAVGAYLNKDYSNSMRQFDVLITVDSANMQYILYAAISALESSDTEKARSYFNALEQYESYREQAEWYAAMSWLKDNDREHTIVALTAIINDRDHYYRSAARKLLRDLN